MSRASKRKEQLAMARAYREKHAPTREATAWHEAAHAVVCEYFDMEVRYVTCEPLVWKGQTYLGYCMSAAEEDGKLFEITSTQGIYALMQGSAGFVCEWIRGTMERGYVDPGDMEELTEIAKGFDIKFEELESIFDTTEDFLRFHWDVIKHVATQLIERGRMEGSELRQIVRARIGYVPEQNQTGMIFEGLVIEPGTEADTRESWPVMKRNVNGNPSQ